MRHTWNDALAAYDREQHVLRQVAEEYDAFQRELLEGVGQRVSGALGAVLGEPSLGGDAPHDWGLDWADPSLPACAGVDVTLYNAAPGGVGVASMALEVRLGLNPAEHWPEPQERRRRVVPAGAAPDRDGPRLVLRRALIPIAGANPVALLADAMIQAVREAKALNARLEEGTALGPVRWARDVMKANPRRVFVDADAGSVNDQVWHGAPRIDGARVGMKAWFALFGDGRVTLHWGAKGRVDDAEHRRVLAAIGLDTADTTRSYAGGIVVHPAMLRDLADRADTEAFVDTLRIAWVRFCEAQGV
jgi:hypothetical protein